MSLGEWKERNDLKASGYEFSLSLYVKSFVNPIIIYDSQNKKSSHSSQAFLGLWLLTAEM